MQSHSFFNVQSTAILNNLADDKVEESKENPEACALIVLTMSILSNMEFPAT